MVEKAVLERLLHMYVSMLSAFACVSILSQTIRVLHDGLNDNLPVRSE